MKSAIQDISFAWTIMFSLNNTMQKNVWHHKKKKNNKQDTNSQKQMTKWQAKSMCFFMIQ